MSDVVPVGSTFPFDALVGEYERYRIGYAGELYDAIESAGVEPGARVLDLACGTGLSTAPLVAAGARVTGIDASPEMLARARARLPETAFDLGRAEDLPYDDDAFDAAICAQSFHWFDQRRAFAETIRVVRPGGVVAIWWKSLMRGDALRLFRGEAARSVGVDFGTAVLGESFEIFDAVPLVHQRLRVIPWLVSTTAAEFLGYERSRARAHAMLGPRMPAYLDALRASLGPPATRYETTYVHYLYLGTVPSEGAR